MLFIYKCVVPLNLTFTMIVLLQIKFVSRAVAKRFTTYYKASEEKEYLSRDFNDL